MNNVHCDKCGKLINPFDGFAELTTTKYIGSGAPNPDHPVSKVIVRAEIFCIGCEPY